MDFTQALTRGVARLRRPTEAKAMSPGQPLGRFYNPGQPALKYDFDPDRAVVDGFKACVWVFACVSLLMRAVGSVPWVVKRRTGGMDEDEWTPDPEDWRQQLLESPNEDMTRNFAMSWMTSHLALNGEAPIKLIRLNDSSDRARTTVGELYPLHPHRFAPIMGEDQYVTGYEAYVRGSRQVIPKDEVIFVRLPDPDNILRGCGMLQAAWSAVRADTAGQKWRAKIFEQGGIPPGAIVDENLVTEDQVKEAAKVVTDSWGRAASEGRPMVFGVGSSFIPFSYNATDLQFLEGREFTVTEICSAFGFHPALFSNNAATYDNMRTAIRHYWMNGAIPLLDTFRDSFNLGLIPKAERKDVWIDYDLSNVEALQENTKEQVETFTRAIVSGISRKEAAQLTRLSIGDADGDDVPLVNPSLRPLAEVAAGDAGMNDGADSVLDSNLTDVPEEDSTIDPEADT